MPFIKLRVEMKDGEILCEPCVWVEGIDHILTNVELRKNIDRENIEEWDFEIVEDSLEYV